MALVEDIVVEYVTDLVRLVNIYCLLSFMLLLVFFAQQAIEVVEFEKLSPFNLLTLQNVQELGGEAYVACTTISIASNYIYNFNAGA